MRFKLTARHNEITSLVAMGLMEDASEEFSEQLRQHAAEAGRKFLAFSMTEQGYLLFRRAKYRSVN